MPLVLMEKVGGAAVITLNRPDRRNALNAELRRELRSVLEEVEEREEFRTAVITGAGDAFAAGADIAAMRSYSPEEAQASAEEGCVLFAFIEDMRVPVIAAVNGWALGGGCELALACDLRICSEEATFGQPELRLGLIPAYGALFRLPRLVGPARARELVYTGRLIQAREAKDLGIVIEVVPAEGLLQRALELAANISPASRAVLAAKKVFTRALDASREETDALACQLYGDLYRTEDLREGLDAFLSKRKPVFKGL